MRRGARPRFFCALWATRLVVTARAAGAATAATTAAGRWAGEIDTPDGKKAEIYLVLDPKDGAWTGSLEDPLQGSAAAPGLKVTATSISFQFQPQGAAFAVNLRRRLKQQIDERRMRARPHHQGCQRRQQGDIPRRNVAHHVNGAARQGQPLQMREQARIGIGMSQAHQADIVGIEQ